MSENIEKFNPNIAGEKLSKTTQGAMFCIVNQVGLDITAS